MADDISDLILREGEKPVPLPPSLSGREPSAREIQFRGDIGKLNKLNLLSFCSVFLQQPDHECGISRSLF